MDLKQELADYCQDVLNDKPLSCIKHKWACMRFLRDIEKENTEDFPFIFKPEKAERFFKWCSLFKHTKGVLTGQHISLAPILKFIFGNVYGWYHKDTGYRRFNKLYWQVARKNAKSQMLALVGSYELMAFNETGEEMQEIYCAATKSEQARIVFDETKAMLNRCKELKPYYKVAYSKIIHIRSNSFMRVLNEEDRKTGDGLNPQCGIIDEYHSHGTSEMYDIIDSGMGARSQPLIAVITTAGFDLNKPCFRVEYQMISKVLDPDLAVEMDNYMIMVNELDKDENGELKDDIKDPACWIKANPIICTYPEGIKYIKDRLKEALEQPEKLRNFLTKNMNIWVHLTEISYLSSARWNKCKVEELPDITGKSCYIGIDFSSKIDLTSISFVIPLGDKYVVLSHSFISEDYLQQKIKTDKVPYELWVKQGWITVLNGSVVDAFEAIEVSRQLFIEKYNLYVEEWCLDPWCAGQIMGRLADDGDVVIEIRQGPKTLSEPTKDFRDMVFSEKIIHDGNPVLAWAVSNAIVDSVDRNENIILSKKKSTERIDPIASVINAHTRAMTFEEYNCSPVSFI